MRRATPILLILAVALGGCIHRSGSLHDSDSTLHWSNTVLLSKAKQTGTTGEYVWNGDGTGKYRISETGDGEDATDALRTMEALVSAFAKAIGPLLVPYIADMVKDAVSPPAPDTPVPMATPILPPITKPDTPGDVKNVPRPWVTLPQQK